MIKIGVFGASGRMGQEIAALAEKENCLPVLGISKRRVALGYQHDSRLEQVEEGLKCDIFLDFSLPEALPEVLSWVKYHKKPLISGVTGYTLAELQQLKSLANEAPVFWSPNFSLGIALFKKWIKSASFLDHYDFQLSESHHKNKKDSPSGTAKLLQDHLQSCLPDNKVLPPCLVTRGGGIIGEHALKIMGDFETITVSHEALNRQVFALGALKVANWLVSRPSGYYNMDDFIN